MRVALSMVLCIDLKADNIVISLADGDSDKLIEQVLESSPSETYPPVNIPELSDNPIVTVKSQPILPTWLEEDLSNLSVKLIDYGSAIPLNKMESAPRDIQVEFLRAPEVTLGHPLSEKMDVWSLGCLTMYLLTGMQFFHEGQSPNDSVAADRNRMHRMIEYLGHFPSLFLQKCSKHHELLDKNGIPIGAVDMRVGEGRIPLTPENFPRSELESLLHTALPSLREQDISEVCAFLRRCWVLDPSGRPSTTELLEDPWLAS